MVLERGLDDLWACAWRKSDGWGESHFHHGQSLSSFSSWIEVLGASKSLERSFLELLEDLEELIACNDLHQEYYTPPKTEILRRRP